MQEQEVLMHTQVQHEFYLQFQDIMKSLSEHGGQLVLQQVTKLTFKRSKTQTPQS